MKHLILRCLSLCLTAALLCAAVLPAVAMGAAPASGASETRQPLMSIDGTDRPIDYENGEYRFTLGEGETFRLHQPIDLRTVTVADDFLKLRIYASEEGTPDIRQITLVLTDAYDPTNYLRVNGTYDTFEYSYWKTGTGEQPLVGYEAWNNMIHVENRAGAWAPVRFVTSSAEDNNILCLSFDPDDLKIYACSNVKGNADVMICDLDNPRYYSTLWSGFTTGEVYLSVYVNEFEKGTTSAAFGLLSAAGCELDGRTGTYDDKAPTIRVDLGDYSADTLPEGAVGYYYPVFPAKAYDTGTGITVPQARVYTGYGTAAGKEVTCDGTRFVPTEAGLHTIVYSAADSCGNMAEQTVQVNVRLRADAIRATENRKGATTASVGARVVLSDVTFSGGMSELTRTATVKGPDGRFRPLDGMTFTPDREGLYIVCMRAVDFCGQTAVYTYQISVTTSDAPVIGLSETLLGYYLAGKTYTLPAASAYDHKAGKSVACEVYADFGDGEKKLSDGLLAIPADAATVRIVYRAGAASFVHTAVVVKSLQENGNLALDAFFDAPADAQKTVGDDCVTVALPTAGDVTFINPLLTVGTLLVLGVSDADRFAVTFADRNREGCVLSVSFLRTGNRLRVSLNGREVFAVTAEETLTLGFSDDGLTFSVNGKTAPVASYGNGRPFTGFSGYTAMFSVSLPAGASLSVSSINRQNFNKEVTMDMMRPQILPLGLYGGSYTIGTVYHVCPVAIADVLDPTTIARLNVKDAKGNYVSDINGRLMKDLPVTEAYDFRLEAYGNYYVSYTADAEGIWDEEMNYTVRCVDLTPPEITFPEIPAEAEIGTVIGIPSYSVSDNVTRDTELTARIWIITPEGKILPLTEKGYRLSAAGIYTIRITVRDKEGNLAFSDRTVTVR